MNRNPIPMVLPEFSNREDIYLSIGVIDDDTNDPIDMTALGWTFQFEIRRLPPRGQVIEWGGPFYDTDFPAPIITASLGNGITIVDVGKLLILIPETKVRNLHHRTYGACLTATDGTRTFQLFKATLPIQYGGVTN